MYTEFDIFQEALPNLLEFLGLDFSGAKQTNFLGGFWYIEHIE